MMESLDPSYPAHSNAVLRYGPALFPESLMNSVRRVSIKEGFRLVPLEPYRGVRLFLLDEATCMHTGTYKTLDGCVTIALAAEKGYSKIACSSGANAGCALAEYGRLAGIETYFFCPATTLYKLSPDLFHGNGNHLISVEGSDRRVKSAAGFFSERSGVPLVPELDWRIMASGIRGMFLAETMKTRGEGFDWFVQAICAGFGPIGLYRVLLKAAADGFLNGCSLPSFLGVQQAALAPIAEAWARGEETLAHPAQWKSGAVIEPSLYNTMPAQTYPMLREIMKIVDGDVATVEGDEYMERAREYLARVEATGIRLARGGNGEPLEKAGLLAGAGVLMAIDCGKIAAGQSALCSLSGGAAAAPSAPVRPELNIAPDDDLEAVLSEYAGRNQLHANSF
jgi:threonine synthase